MKSRKEFTRTPKRLHVQHYNVGTKLHSQKLFNNDCMIKPYVARFN